MSKKAKRRAAKAEGREVVTSMPAPPSPAPLSERRGIDFSQARSLREYASRPVYQHKVYEPFKGVLPEGKRLAQDEVFGSVDWANAAQQSTFYGDMLGNAFAEGMVFPGYPYLSELAQRPEYRRGAEILAIEMTREWITLGSKKDGDNKADRIEALTDALNRFHVRDKFRRAAEIDGFMGRAQLFLDVGSKNVASPLLLTPQTVRKNSLVSLTILEPMWSYPTAYNSTEPLAPDFYKPPAWYVMGQEVSSTRLLTFVGREVPDLLKPSYAFGGISLTQMAKPYVDNWLRARQSVSDLIDKFSKVTLKTDMGSQVGAECSGQSLFDRMAFFTNVRTNSGIMLLDNNTEELTEVATPLGGLSDLQWDALKFVCAVYGIPPLVYLQLSPGGLNTDSDGVIRTFYDSIHARQEDYFRDPLQRVLDLLQLNEFGDIDPDITFSFNPLWQMSAKEKAEVRKIDADTAAVYVAAAILEPMEERERLAADPESIYTTIDPGDAPEVPGVDDMETDETEVQAAEGGGENAA